MSGESRARGGMRPAGGRNGTVARAERRATPLAGDRTAREEAPATRARPVVVKLGGRALEAPGALREFVLGLARLSRVTLLVHGGGAEVTSWCERLGLAPRFVDGLRVTDEDTLEVATAVLAGLANKRLVAALRAEGVDAVGLAALDGGTLVATAHPEARDLGAVGAIASLDASLLATLLADGRTPVLASVAADESGALLNVNADDAAAAIAVAVGASDLVLLSDTPGLVLHGRRVPALAAGELAGTLARADVSGGMRPKLRAAGAALQGGVARVHIAAWGGPETLEALLAGDGGGTMLHANGTLVEERHA